MKPRKHWKTSSPQKETSGRNVHQRAFHKNFYSKTFKLARSNQTSKQDATLIKKGTKENPIQVDQMHTKELDRTRHRKNFTCYQCRRMDGHSLDECGEISLRCTAYKKMGHLARSSKNPKRSDKKAHNLRAGWINEETSSDDEKEPVYSRNKQDSSVLVNLNGWKTKMIMDTACKYNIIFSELYKSQFKHYELKKTKKRFVAYGQKDALN
ncbi:hypothetical protein pdam_00024362 [Pocillopora damicornis]|uniref:Uncharacterized protein n=1 Tax=Pocillopora damicornis TaxID=46731 RepID=A0A3M6TWT9_POCDA|nr:hypothetical protein pdam_00024362 [Pocillopora damicornis]